MLKRTTARSVAKMTAKQKISGVHNPAQALEALYAKLLVTRYGGASPDSQLGGHPCQSHRPTIAG
jgi:hypothetical protein